MENPVLLRLISDANDTMNIRVSDIITFDTAKDLLIISPQISEKLRSSSFQRGSAALDNKGVFIKVHLHDVFSEEYEGEPSIATRRGNICFYESNALLVHGEIWKKVVSINSIPIR